jgi:hypothetical protein
VTRCVHTALAGWLADVPLQDVQAEVHALWGATLYHVDNLPYSSSLQDLPDVFTPFRKCVEAQCQVGRLDVTANLSQGGHRGAWEALALASGACVYALAWAGRA